jgi:septal ring factor EnvC (AmiA/AmiB activator)
MVAMWSLIAILLSVVPVAPVVPVPGPVLEGFRPPACERCAGRRGVVIGSQPGAMVRAVRSGPITYAGYVGGRLYVVQSISPGVRVTYGWLAVVGDIAVGEEVMGGQALGIAGERTYLGVRLGQTYIEPLRYLGLGGSRLRGPGHVIVGPRVASR